MIERWLSEPHVARWWTPETTAAAEVAEYREGLVSGSRTKVLTVLEDDLPIGWCQWYRWADYPAEAMAMEARPREVGVDYALGEPDSVGRGLGTQLIAALMSTIRSAIPGAGFLVAVESDNVASRRVLEKNGFMLVEVRPVASEPHDRPMAILRTGS